MSSWVVTGAAGALGSDLVDLLHNAGQSVTGVGHEQLDLTQPAAALHTALDAIGPDVIVNAAAYTRVDDAESDEAKAFAVNGRAPGLLAAWTARHGARLIHVSTDYVFAGDADRPYEPDDPTGPATAYGRTKLAGEQAVLAVGGDVQVVRTGWLYGERGTSFIRTVGGRLRDGVAVQVVTDQVGAPTWTRPLAERLIALGTADVTPGVRHCSAAGAASWYDVATALGEELGVDPTLVTATTSAGFPRPAPRPAYSVLSDRSWQATGLPPMPDWREMLRAALPTVL